jgi:hypothetical protein
MCRSRSEVGGLSGRRSRVAALPGFIRPRRLNRLAVHEFGCPSLRPGEAWSICLGTSWRRDDRGHALRGGEPAPHVVGRAAGSCLATPSLPKAEHRPGRVDWSVTRPGPAATWGARGDLHDGCRGDRGGLCPPCTSPTRRSTATRERRCAPGDSTPCPRYRWWGAGLDRAAPVGTVTEVLPHVPA